MRKRPGRLDDEEASPGGRSLQTSTYIKYRPSLHGGCSSRIPSPQPIICMPLRRLCKNNEVKSYIKDILIWD
ncbi:hypothetical protein TNCV_1441581 [Trichonephila clavipes]|uniref:Uncharacterized protein n=1 Tax=Trichonephila clavipes TaxID=2585209 RepID=A0A8X6RPR2_TRICX|nr:hypothetical protein TNCV_1441581 [Trichonephila clavipes]